MIFYDLIKALMLTLSYFRVRNCLWKVSLKVFSLGWGNAAPALTGKEVGGNETDLTEAQVRGEGEAWAARAEVEEEEKKRRKEKKYILYHIYHI